MDDGVERNVTTLSPPDDSVESSLRREIARLQAENEALRKSSSLEEQQKEFNSKWYQRHMQRPVHEEAGIIPMPLQYRSIAEELEPFITDEVRRVTSESGLLTANFEMLNQWNEARGESTPATIFRVAKVYEGEQVSTAAKEAVARGLTDLDTFGKTPVGELGRFYDLSSDSVYAFASKVSSRVFFIKQHFPRLRAQFAFKQDFSAFMRRCAEGNYSGSCGLMVRFLDHQLPELGGASSLPLLLLEDDGSQTFCFMFHGNIYKDYCPMIRSWAVRDMLMLKNAPLSKILVEPKSGILIWQNPASCSLIGVHSLENKQPSPGQKITETGLNFLGLLFQYQDDLRQEMLDTVGAGISFNRRMEIKSYELKRMMGYGPTEPLWHKVFASQLQEPFSGKPTLCIVHVDETAIVLAEMRVKALQTQQQSLLAEILPQQVTDILLSRLSRASGSTTQKGGDVSVKWVSDLSESLDRMSTDSGGSIPGLSRQNVQDLATSHDEVSILFADIKGFTPMSACLHPSRVMLLLNDLFHKFDDLLEKYDVYKVETIGDCYVCATGLFDRMDEEDSVQDCLSKRRSKGLPSCTGFPCLRRDGGWGKLGGKDPHHAKKMIKFALAMSEAAAEIDNPLDGSKLEIRVGVHSGPCHSGVVGRKMPRFCLFGDTINTASRMESTGEPGRIHVSAATASLVPEVHWEEKTMQVKGKGEMQTFFYPQGLVTSPSIMEESPFLETEDVQWNEQ